MGFSANGIQVDRKEAGFRNVDVRTITVALKRISVGVGNDMSNPECCQLPSIPYVNCIPTIIPYLLADHYISP